MVPLSRRRRPAAFVAPDAVTPADEDEVVAVGAAGIGPAVDVVHAAPLGWCLTAGEHASAISHPYGAALGAGGEAGAATDVEDLAAPPDDAADEAVAGEALDGAGRDGPDAGEVPAGPGRGASPPAMLAWCTSQLVGVVAPSALHSADAMNMPISCINNASMRSRWASNSSTSTDTPNMRSPYAAGVTVIAGARLCALQLSHDRDGQANHRSPWNRPGRRAV
jgi:hypothetical protein